MNPEDINCPVCGGRRDGFFPMDSPHTCNCGNRVEVVDPTVPWMLTGGDRRFLRGAGIKVDEEE
jgi:hypothetical protein